MSARKNAAFSEMPHDEATVDKLAWRGDIKVELPTPVFSPTSFLNRVLASADTGVRFADAWIMPNTRLVVAQYIFDAEGREQALQRAICVTLAGIVETDDILASELKITEFKLNWLFTQRIFAEPLEDVLSEVPPIFEVEVPHHPLAA
jgi:hypothetical protein